MVSWASGVSMIGGNPGAWSGRLCAHRRSRPSHPVDPRTGAVGGPQLGLLSVSWTMISPWSGRRYANGFMVPRRLWSLSPVGTVGRHGRSAWSVGRGSAPSRSMVMVFGVFGETLCPWLHCPTLPADILFHWDSYQKNSSIFEICVILIFYYVLEIGSFKV